MDVEKRDSWMKVEDDETFESGQNRFGKIWIMMGVERKLQQINRGRDRSWVEYCK